MTSVKFRVWPGVLRAFCSGLVLFLTGLVAFFYCFYFRDIPHLLRSLDSGSTMVRVAAWKRLGNLVAHDETAVPTLAAFLDDIDPDMERNAALMLWVFNKKAPEALSEAVPALSKRLTRAPSSPDAALGTDAFELARWTAGLALISIARYNDEAFKTLNDVLTDGNTQARECVAGSLDRFPVSDFPKVIPILSRVLAEDPAPEVRVKAAGSLADIGRFDAEVVPVLVKAFKDANAYVRATAIRALKETRYNVPEYLPALLKALHDEHQDVRAAAASALAGRPGDEVVPALIEALSDTSPKVREAAGSSLYYMGGKAAEAVPALIHALQDSDKPVRYHAANVLNKVGPAAAPAIPALAKVIIEDEFVEVRLEASYALEHLAPHAAEMTPNLVAALMRVLSNEQESSFVRSSAAQALQRIGPAAKEAAPDLVAALDTDRDDSSAYVRASAASALGAVGGDPGQTIPALVQAFRNENKRRSSTGFLVRQSIIDALDQLGASGPEVVEVLKKALRDEDLQTRIRAAKSLAKLGHAQEAVSALLRILKNRKSDTPFDSVDAAKALGEIGPPAQDAIPALTDALDDDWCQAAARTALDKINGVAGEALSQ